MKAELFRNFVANPGIVSSGARPVQLVSRFVKSAFSLAVMAVTVASTNGAIIIEAVPGGLLNQNFSTVDGTGPGISTFAYSSAIGIETTSSAFGAPHDFTFTFTPGTDPTNFTPETGTLLGQDMSGNSIFATGITQDQLLDGGTGMYRVLATWANRTNVVNTTTFTITSDLEDIVLVINQNSNAEGVHFANKWGHLATVPLTVGNTYTVRMTSDSAFVSQIIDGIMFEPIPEPSTITLLIGILALLAVSIRRRR